MVRAPRVQDPADLVVAPGGAVRQTFRVTNLGAVAREYRFTATSSDAGLVPTPASPPGQVVGAGQTADVPVESTVVPGAAAGRASAVALEVVDVRDEALSGRGRFAVTAGAALEAPEITGPAPVEVDPGATVVVRWSVRNRSNVARLMELAPRSADPSLTLLAVAGSGRLRIEPGSSREVEATFRLASPSTAGSVRPAVLSARDVLSPGYAVSSSVPVSTRLASAAPDVSGPADRTELPGRSFTASWTVANRTNAARRFTITPSLDAPSELAVVASTPTGTVTVPEGGTTVVSVTYQLRADALASTRSVARLQVVDADAPSLSASGSFTATTALVLAAPAVGTPGDRSAGPGDPVAVSWTIRNATNAPRVLTVSPGAPSGGELAVEGSTGTGSVTFAPFETRTALVTYRVGSGSVGGSVSTARLDVGDRDAPQHAGSNSFRFTTTTVLKAPAVASLGDRSGDPGAGGTASYRLVNQSNVRRSFRLVATSSNAAAVPDPADPAVVAVEPFASVELEVPFRVEVRAVAGSTSALALRATDAGDATWTGEAAAAFTTNLVVKAPSLGGGGSRSGLSGETHTLVFPLTNQTNGMRRFSFAVASSNPAVVPSPGPPGEVDVEPFATVEVTVPFRFGAGASAALEGTLTLTAADAGAAGHASAATGSVVRINRPPTVSPGFTPDGEYTLTRVQAFANAGDPDGSVATYEWYAISPSGAWSPLGGEANPATTFPRPGTWRLWLRVTDNNGGEATATSGPITVRNRAPTAAPRFSPDGQYTFVPVQLHADASDADGTVTGAVWYTIDPSGTWRFAGDGAEQSFTPTRPGTWRAHVVVTDDSGAQTGVTTGPITVANRPPGVAPSFDPDGQPPGSPVRLHANGSDPDGTVSAFAWYVIDPQGGWSYVGAAADLAFTPDRPGTWYGYVVATDDAGGQGAGYTSAITVAHVPGCTDPGARNYAPAATLNDGSCAYNRAPVAVLDVSYAEGRSFAWEGEEVLLDLRRSWDPDGDPLTGSLGSGMTGTVSWGTSGSYDITGTVSDGRSTGSATATVLVRSKVIGCMDPGASNFDPAANVPGTCVYANAPPEISSFTLRNVAPCWTGIGRGWYYQADVVASDPDSDVLTYRWTGIDGQRIGGSGSSLRSPCWLRVYRGGGPAYVEVSDGRGGTAREYFDYTPLE